jgi:tetratricopeptide (TPR) repeat protein
VAVGFSRTDFGRRVVVAQATGSVVSSWKPVLAFVVFMAAFTLYTRHAAPSVTAGDSGEFITAAATLSLPHSPSFPLYVVASRCFVTALPFGSVGYRCNLVSALTSALALVVVLWCAWSVGAGMFAGLSVVLVLAFSGSFWENSLVTEVFALNTLLAAAVLGALLRTNQAAASNWWAALFLMGVGAGNHQVLLFVGPMFGVVGWLERRWIWQRSIFLVGTAAFLIGFSIYLVLPIRAQANPPLNWGRPTTATKLVHTVLRRDYGTLTLALGDKPDRSFGHAARHLSFFGRKMAHELGWPLLAIGFGALAWGIWNRHRVSYLALAGFAFTGPFFIWLGNLPLTAQSEGIIGRFLILPVLFLVVGLIPLVGAYKRAASAVLLLLACGQMGTGWALASDHRQGLLVLDYGRAMLRSLPSNAALFMDGGDDAFYSLAMLQNAMGKRPDVELHDRGGLVFPNPYGDDFRSLPKDQKPQRRWTVEKQRLAVKPLYYVTMDPNVLPGVSTELNGILVQTAPVVTQEWPFYVLRSLYPPRPDTYRMRALATYFPFAYGRGLQVRGQWREALRAYARAAQIGAGVDWFSTNLSYELSQWGYQALTQGRIEQAEAIYRFWVQVEPTNMQAQSNWGVALERAGRIEEARAQYERTAQLFPTAADPVFNLSVLAWRRGDWTAVERYLLEVLRRDPRHAQAPGYLANVRLKLQGVSGAH